MDKRSGQLPLVRDKEQLKYYAVLMYTWISSKPLNMIYNYWKHDKLLQKERGDMA